jgi:Protein kinase domain
MRVLRGMIGHHQQGHRQDRDGPALFSGGDLLNDGRYCVERRLNSAWLLQARQCRHCVPSPTGRVASNYLARPTGYPSTAHDVVCSNISQKLLPLFAPHQSLSLSATVGATAVVYAATDRHTGRRVALKVVACNSNKVPVSVVRREVALSSSVAHPNIVQLLDLFAEGTQLVIVVRAILCRLRACHATNL